MQLGMIGLGRMGANMVRRLLDGGHQCVVFDRLPEAVDALVAAGAIGVSSVSELATRLTKPRAVWLMVPVAVVDTSGGVWGRERGYCLMIGGEAGIVKHLDPIFARLAPGIGHIAPTPGREALGGTAEQGYLHCGPSGAGHFVKMVHNGIEYGLMAAYAEGMGVLRAANIGKEEHAMDAETTPLRDPSHYQFDLDLRDIAEVWRRGSVIASWLLDLTAAALVKDSDLSGFAGRVSDSGEGRWTIKAAIDEAVPVPVLSAALYQRFSSRGESDFQDKLLSAMRYEFGGHVEKKVGS
jgi:6-phosphogluconate dehydrogenase